MTTDSPPSSTTRLVTRWAGPTTQELTASPRCRESFTRATDHQEVRNDDAYRVPRRVEPAAGGDASDEGRGVPRHSRKGVAAPRPVGAAGQRLRGDSWADRGGRRVRGVCVSAVQAGGPRRRRFDTPADSAPRVVVSLQPVAGPVTQEA